jgi:hypothetical protein
MKLHAAAAKLVHGVGAAGTRDHRGRLVRPERSAELNRDGLIRCNVGLTETSYNQDGRSTNDCKSPHQLKSAGFTIAAEEVHIDTFRVRLLGNPLSREQL